MTHGTARNSEGKNNPTSILNVNAGKLLAPTVRHGRLSRRRWRQVAQFVYPDRYGTAQCRLSDQSSISLICAPKVFPEENDRAAIHILPN